MKIIHCADLHLDSKMTANLDSARAKERKAEILNTFVKMVDYAVDEDVKAIIIAGDMFDTANVSALARNTVRDAIVMHSDIDFYYLLGNHDRDNFLSSLEDIPTNLKLFAGDWVSYPVDESGSVVISGIELNSDNAKSCYNSLILDQDKVNIVTLHGQEAETMSRDKAQIISLKELRNKNIDYLALGHIHGYKEEALDGRGVYCYSGCLEGRGFDELGEHGFVMLDVDTKLKKVDRRFVPFASRRLHELDVDISGITTTAQIIDKIDAKMQKCDIPARDLLKIVLSGEVDVECEKDVSYVLKHYEPGYYFVKVYDESHIKINYEDYRLDESLKGEFVRMVMQATDITEAEKPHVIRVGLMAIAGEEIEL